MRKINYQNQKTREDFLNEYYNICISQNFNAADVSNEIIKLEGFETWDFKRLVTANFNELIDFAKKIDDLQAVIALCRKGNYEIPLQFVNMK